MMPGSPVPVLERVPVSRGARAPLQRLCHPVDCVALEDPVLVSSDSLHAVVHNLLLGYLLPVDHPGGGGAAADIHTRPAQPEGGTAECLH